MKILVTGSKGFVGQNLIAELNNIKEGKCTYPFITSELEILEYDIDTDPKLLDKYCKEADFIFHLAGVNRPKDPKDFMEGNFGFTSVLLDTLKKYKSKAPILITSSIQANLNNPYGESKKAGENLIFKYSLETQNQVYVYRLHNVFGKWCKPNYNSVIATFCYNIARNLPIQINNPNTKLSLNYIDDVVESFLEKLSIPSIGNFQIQSVSEIYESTLGSISELLYSFVNNRKTLYIPDMSDLFVKKLYSTYLSYLPEDQFSYPLKMNIDDRGSFTEILKSATSGQVSVNISKPHVTKGNHWHHTKNEKFLVVSGTGIIRFRKLNECNIIEYHVTGDKLEVIDIPVGYTHNIENLGDSDMVTIMWVNEIFDKNKPDTFFLAI